MGVGEATLHPHKVGRGVGVEVAMDNMPSFASDAVKPVVMLQIVPLP